MIERLLGAGASINEPTYEDHTALAQAAFNGQADACRLLATNGADVNLGRKESGESPLHCATVKKHRAVVIALLEQGADANKTSRPGLITSLLYCDVLTCGESPLHYAAAYCDLKTIEILIKGGADKSLKTIYGEIPFQWAGRFWRNKEVRRILEP